MGDGSERRVFERYPALGELTVDWASGENFLFSYIANISEMGIFIRSDAPPSVGTELRLRFSIGDEPEQLHGTVVWINPIRDDGDNPNPGMGVRFDGLTADQREQVVAIMRAIAYLQS